jgi:hypothetical protein
MPSGLRTRSEPLPGLGWVIGHRVRFHERRRLTKVGPGVKHGRCRGTGKSWMHGSIRPFQFGLPRDIKLTVAKTTRDQTIPKHTEPAFIEPMQCKPVTALPAGETLKRLRPKKRPATKF